MTSIFDNFDKDCQFSLPEAFLALFPFFEGAQEMLLVRDKISSLSAKRVQLALVFLDRAFSVLFKSNFKMNDKCFVAINKMDVLRYHVSEVLSRIQQIDNSAVTITGADSRPQVSLLLLQNGVKSKNSYEGICTEVSNLIEVADEARKLCLAPIASSIYHLICVLIKALVAKVPEPYLRTSYPLIQKDHTHCAKQFILCNSLRDNLIAVDHLDDGLCVEDRYDVFEGKQGLLGEGSYGSVRQCRCKVSGKLYACKALVLQKLNSYTLRKWHLEIHILRSLCHPNIAKLHEVFYSDVGNAFTVIDLCTGSDLYSFMLQHKEGINEDYAASLMKDMVSAVSYLHKKGYIHRDLKLENFLFESDRPDARVVLIDFGLSKRCFKSGYIFGRAGSACYLAPEVLNQYYDQRSDVWSLGIILFVMLYGYLPFNGKNVEEISFKILHNPVCYGTRPISKNAMDILHKLLVKEADYRISLNEAIQHPFLNYYVKADGFSLELCGAAPFSRMMIGSVFDFYFSSPPKKFVHYAVASVLSNAQLTDCSEHFHTLDFDRTGLIPLHRIQMLLGLSFDNESGYLDDVCIDYFEFVAASLNILVVIDDACLNLAFDRLSGRKKCLNASDVSAMLGADGKPQDVAMIMQEVDGDNDGTISYSDFCSYFKSVHSIFNSRSISNRSSSLVGTPNGHMRGHSRLERHHSVSKFFTGLLGCFVPNNRGIVAPERYLPERDAWFLEHVLDQSEHTHTEHTSHKPSAHQPVSATESSGAFSYSDKPVSVPVAALPATIKEDC